MREHDVTKSDTSPLQRGTRENKRGDGGGWRNDGRGMVDDGSPTETQGRNWGWRRGSGSIGVGDRGQIDETRGDECAGWPGNGAGPRNWDGETGGSMASPIDID